MRFLILLGPLFALPVVVAIGLVIAVLVNGLAAVRHRDGER